ncbi:protein-glutamate O-methyltransferase CheR [Tropicimonas sp. IMCC6043]|uniref:CheR family methyltransferase n=1 Tax=Tropicimonas sp. IMCC6043 TaxID=2510645 RepID=UPI00101E0938|nr:protein-glutamate O-methyltransferase [Tropicimonas sp. IMCC6043]RYH09739.1 chemotaxis protein [Tropicimonas sp. IMCC6043]
MNAPTALNLPQPQTLDPQALRDFETLARIAREEAGLVIPPEKAAMVFSRVSKRLRALGISDRSVYCKMLESRDETAERRQLVSALTTNVTSFFREPHHFDTLKEAILPELTGRARAGERVRIWSAGCSTGPEPYSIAMAVFEKCPEALDLDIKILATDIDPAALATARSGSYSSSQVSAISEDRRRLFFRKPDASTHGSECAQVSDRLTGLISFRELNLLASWPMKFKFDVIFCRNVVIYFDRETQNALWPRFAQACRPGGYLFVGHSERLDDDSLPHFRSVGTTTYQRTNTN